LPHPLRIAVLASHEGTTLQAILDACATERLACRVVLVISNNSDSGALRRARAFGVPALHFSSVTHPDPAALDRAMAQALADSGAELVMLAGYMRKLGPELLKRFARGILNTHPSLLPKFGGQGMYGARVHQAVLDAQERESGATVHLVDGGYDTGPVLAQARVPVVPGDTIDSLAARVQQQERELLLSVLSRIASGELELANVADNR
jgi:phosphoribosylglycinamide formyltransferase-1